MSPSVFIETYGCQMNEADSELVAGLLRGRGYALAEAAEDADVVLLNTCAVRERAEERIFGRLGWLKTLKAERPEVVLGVAGCMAERMRERLLERAPFVDLVVGPDAYRRLPELIERAARTPDSQIDVRLDRDELYTGLDVDRRPGISGWLTVMRGCDKFCTFCIVPFVRGRERSLAPGEVIAEARAMAVAGFREVTLLGQTVSSYYVGGNDFADLLRAVHAVDGLARIRYTSPYPNDFSDRLLDALAELPRVARHVHLPVQSGSTRILKDMQRGYSAEGFRALVHTIRRRLPAHAITTDIIVGYPGETDADYEATLDLVRDLRFDGAFMFKYSERDGTRAARARPDDVPSEVKRERLMTLIELQEGICREIYRGLIGSAVEVLVVGPSKRDETRLIGRTSAFRAAVLPAGAPYAAGDLVGARVVDATSHTLFVEPLPS